MDDRCKSIIEFADEADIAPWADSAVDRLTGASIIRALTETKFGPREDASRAQSAVLLKRMLQAMQYINTLDDLYAV